MPHATRRTQSRRRRALVSPTRPGAAEPPHGPRCRCGGHLVPVLGARTLEEALGPTMGARVNAIIARFPPAPGELVELAPDHRSARWRGADGRTHELEILPPVEPAWPPFERDGIMIEDDGEDDDEGWELESDDDEQVA